MFGFLRLKFRQRPHYLLAWQSLYIGFLDLLKNLNQSLYIGFALPDKEILFKFFPFSPTKIELTNGSDKKNKPEEGQCCDFRLIQLSILLSLSVQ